MCVDHRRYGISGVMEAVDELKAQGDEQSYRQQNKGKLAG